ncbi:MAG: hypothetical protein IPK80_01250 [Nannocystis sp.]|nr:hypothetical protein [Nannocystis sp.]
MSSSSVVQFLPENYNQKAILDLLHALSCTPGLTERLMRCLERFPDLERQIGAFEDRCRTTVQRCEATERLCQAYMCPGNVNFSQRTLDEYSNRSLVKLKEPVTGLGGDFVNAFPVPPGKKIRLTHPARPGFTPTRMRVDMNIAGGGNNYSDFTLQFYLVPGGVNSDQGLEVGNSNDGNMFLNKDGSQLEVQFPQYRGNPLDIGSLEKLAVVITNNGAVNNLDSAHVNVWYDNDQFFELCKARCGC